MTKKINNITIKDVAKKAGVSIATVSHVINKTRYVSKETKEKVIEAINELDYFPNVIAKSLRGKKTGTIGLILCDMLNPFFSEILHGIEAFLSEEGYDLLLTNTNYIVEKENKASEMFYSKSVDGVIIALGGNNSRPIEYLLARNIPVVLIDKIIPELKVDAVIVNNVEGSRNLINHVVKIGHSRIGIISGPTHSYTGMERLNGYYQSMRENSLPIEDDLIKIGDFKEESGYILANELINMDNPPTIIYVCNNMMALGAMRALYERKIDIPKDMGIVIFDDLPWFPYVKPPLTVIAQPLFDLGKEAVKILIQRIKKKTKRVKPEIIILEPKLLVRESAGELLSPNNIKKDWR